MEEAAFEVDGISGGASFGTGEATTGGDFGGSGAGKEARDLLTATRG